MTTKTQTPTVPEHGETVFIPLNKLKKHPTNARKTPHSEASIEAKAASIAAKGILQNLVVEPEFDAEGEPTGSYLVSVGEGRRLAQLLRAKRREIKQTEPIRCVIDTANDAAEISLDENVTREDLLGSVSQLSCWVARPSWLWARITGHIKEGTWTSGSSVPAAKRGQRLRRRRHHKLVHEVQD